MQHPQVSTDLAAKTILLINVRYLVVQEAGSWVWDLELNY